MKTSIRIEAVCVGALLLLSGQATVSGAGTIDALEPLQIQRLPTITIPTLSSSVGAGLQVENNLFYLDTPQGSGAVVHIESSDPTRVLVAPDPFTVGTASIDVSLPDDRTYGYFTFQGVEGAAGLATVTVSAPGIFPSSRTIEVVQPALQIRSLPATSTPLTPDTPFYVVVGIPEPGNSYVRYAQSVRAGSSQTATLRNSNALVAQLWTLGGSGQVRTVRIPGGLENSPGDVLSGGVAFDSLVNGITSVTATIPGFITTTAGTVTVEVSDAAITISHSLGSIGAGIDVPVALS